VRIVRRVHLIPTRSIRGSWIDQTFKTSIWILLSNLWFKPAGKSHLRIKHFYSRALVFWISSRMESVCAGNSARFGSLRAMTFATRDIPIEVGQKRFVSRLCRSGIASGEPEPLDGSGAMNSGALTP